MKELLVQKKLNGLLVKDINMEQVNILNIICTICILLYIMYLYIIIYIIIYIYLRNTYIHIYI